MQERSWRESFRVEAHQVVDRFKELVHEGNVRRVVIKHDEHVVAEFPLTAAVVGTVLAPMVAAVGASATLATHSTIEVERVDTSADAPPTSARDDHAARGGE